MPEADTDATSDTGTTDTTGTGDTSSDTTTTTDLGDAGKKALDAMKAERNAAKAEAKKLADRIEQLERATMNDQEKAVAEAKAAGRAEAFAELSPQIVTAEFKAAFNGAVEDDALSTIIDGINVQSFLGDDGTVLVDKVKSFVAGIAPAAASTDLGQGARGTGTGPVDPLLATVQQFVGNR